MDFTNFQWSKLSPAWLRSVSRSRSRTRPSNRHLTAPQHHVQVQLCGSQVQAQAQLRGCCSTCRRCSPRCRPGSQLPRRLRAPRLPSRLRSGAPRWTPGAPQQDPRALWTPRRSAASTAAPGWVPLHVSSSNAVLIHVCNNWQFLLCCKLLLLLLFFPPLFQTRLLCIIKRGSLGATCTFYHVSRAVHHLLKVGCAHCRRRTTAWRPARTRPSRPASWPA